jgi:hypothetical protein
MWTLHVLWQYVAAVFHYWWTLLVGFPAYAAVNGGWKFIHKDRKDIPLPHWVRITLAIAVAVTALFLVYRDSVKNLSIVIQDKAKLASDDWWLQHDLDSYRNHPVVCPKVKGCPAIPVQAAPQAGAQTPAQTSVPAQAPNHTETWLERITRENKAMTSDEHNRFSTLLYNTKVQMEDMEKVGNDLNHFQGRLNASIQNGSLVKDYQGHQDALSDYVKRATAIRQRILDNEQNWNFFPDQYEYVLGNGANAYENAFLNAAGIYQQQLKAWDGLGDKRDTVAATMMLTSVGPMFTGRMKEFQDWKGGFNVRVKEMNQSFQ